MQAPQTPCSQPTFVPVRPAVVADEVRQERARLDIALVGCPLISTLILTPAPPRSRAAPAPCRAPGGARPPRPAAASAAASCGSAPSASARSAASARSRRRAPHRAARCRHAAWSHHGGRAGRREVAVRARVLREAAARALGLLRHLDLDEQLVRLARGVERTEEELGRLQRARAARRAQVEARAERDQRRRQLRGRVGVRDRAAHRPARCGSADAPRSHTALCSSGHRARRAPIARGPPGASSRRSEARRSSARM